MTENQAHIILQALDCPDIFSACEQRFIDRMAEVPGDYVLSEQENKHLLVISRRLVSTLSGAE